MWVANDLNYPSGDCRNDSDVTTVTDAQVAPLAEQFDTNILPKESQYFSVAPDRDGSHAQVGDPGYYSGAKSYSPEPVEWAVDSQARDGNPALWAGEGNELDRSLVYDVTVPSADPTLTFASRYDLEQGWDFGVVQVSTDGGKTYTSLPDANTTSEHDPAAEGRIVAQLPGLTGVQKDWTDESYDLSAYAGQKVLVSFRYLTDSGTNGNGVLDPSGWWVDDVAVGGTSVTDGSSLDGARTATQVSPVPVAGWNVQVVGWTLDGKKVYYQDLALNRNNRASLSYSDIRATFGKADRIGVIVTADDPAEVATQYADYTLTVNGVRQPGGR